MPIKNNNAVIAGISAVLMCAIVYIYWSQVHTPLRKSILEENKRAAELTDKLAAAKSRAGQLSKIQAEMGSLQIDVAELEKLLPKSRELPSLLRVLTHRAEVSGLMLSSIRPQKSIAKGLYDEVPYEISATSSLNGIGHFLTSMGKGDRMFAARNLALTAAASSNDPSKTVNATFTLVAFKYHE